MEEGLKKDSCKKQYIKRVNEKYDLFNIFKYSIILNIILFGIDYYNLFVKNIKYLREINGFIIFLVIGISIIFFIELYRNKLYKVFNSKLINVLDKILFVKLYIEAILILNIIIFFEYWKLIVWFILFIVNLLFLLYRIKQCRLTHIDSNNIKELYDNKIKKNNNEILILEEKPIESKKDDLLDESIFVNSLSKIIMGNRNIDTNVIGLIGDWARGKTSIINMVKENCKNIRISTFDPWKYNDENVLFSNFYNHLIKEINCGYNTFELNNKFLKYFELIFGILKKKYGIANIITQKNNDVDKIKNEIDEILQISEKKVVIVIDDLDRLNKEQILFIFKALKSIINFKNITYILCYDEERIKKMFKRDFRIDFKYLDKIVNNKVYCPKLNNITINNISNICLKNLFEYYCIDKTEDERMNKVIDYISKDINDIRELIRFINMLSLSLSIFKDLKLNIVDFIGLEFIKFKYNYEYNLIYINRKYFVSKSTEFYNDGYDYYFLDLHTKKTKEIYNVIFLNKDRLLNITAEIFENVKKYNANKDDFKLTDEFWGVGDKYNSNLYKRVYNGKYFNIFFNYNANFFTLLNSNIDEFIDEFNKDEKELKELINNLYIVFDKKDMSYVFEMLALKIEYIRNVENLYDEFFGFIDETIENKEVFQLGSRDRLNILLAKSIETFDDELAKKKIDKLIKNNILIADNVCYWLAPSKYDDKNKNEIKFKYFEENLNRIANEYISNKIDIFNKKIYKHNFGWFIWRRLEEKNKEKMIDYVKKLINNENVFRVLYDCTSRTISDVERFKFRIENASQYVDLSLLEAKINEVEYELTKEQSILKNCYELRNKDELEILNDIIKPDDFDENNI